MKMAQEIAMLLPLCLKRFKIVKLFKEFIGTMLAHLIHSLVINLPDKYEIFLVL